MVSFYYWLNKLLVESNVWWISENIDLEKKSSPKVSQKKGLLANVNNVVLISLTQFIKFIEKKNSSTKLSLCYSFNKLFVAFAIVIKIIKVVFAIEMKRSSQGHLQHDLSLFEHLIYVILNVREVFWSLQ